MVNDQKITNFPRTPLLNMLYSENQALHMSPSRVVSHPTRPRESKTSDFAAYYRHCSASRDPACSVTSHHTRALLPPSHQLHTFPCSAVTWNPYVQTSSLEDGCDWKDTRCVPPDFRNELPFKRYDDDSYGPPFPCRCVKCTDSQCPGNKYTSFRPPAYRTTIMTFRDQCTMTLRLNEAATAVTPVTSGHGSDSDADCDYAVRDLPRTFTPDRGKPILKNRNDCCNDFEEGLPPSPGEPPSPRPQLSLPYYYHFTPEPGSPERDKDTEVEHVVEPNRLSSFFKFLKKKDVPRRYCPNRRPLYNEGISDIKAGNLPCCDRPEIISSAANATKLRRKVSTKIKYCSNESKSKIPHAHHNDSKFHHDCTNPPGSGGSDVPAPRRVVPSSRINKTAMSSNFQTAPPPASSKIPRKLLTSERGLDSYEEERTFASTLKHTRPKRI